MITPRTGYRQVADELRDAIMSGRYRPGARMPSEQDLMGTYGISRTTARRAVQELAGEGLVDVVHGAPTRVRVEPVRVEVRIQRGTTMIVRPATPGERRELGLPLGAQMVEVRHGAKTTAYASDRHVFTFA